MNPKALIAFFPSYKSFQFNSFYNLTFRAFPTGISNFYLEITLSDAFNYNPILIPLDKEYKRPYLNRTA